jgi:hypothetical protein
LSVHSEKRKHFSTWRWVGLILLFFVCNSTFAQNTKGDKPIRPLPRIAQKSKPAKGKKVKSNTRDISGRRLRTKNKSTAARAVVSASSPYKGRASRSGDRPGKPIGGRPVRIRSSSAQLARNNVYPNKGPYINNPSRKPRKSERSFPNAGPIGNPRLLGRSKASSIPKKSRVAPVSASRSFLTRGRKNVYWGKFSKGERAFTKDITGRPLRTKNFKTPPIGLISQPNPYQGRTKAGDKAGRPGQAPLSISSNGRAWKGDISGKPIRQYSTKSRIEKAGEFFFPRKLSSSGQRRSNRPLSGSGLIKSKRQGKSNMPLTSSAPGGADVGSFKGFSKERKGFGDQGTGFSGSNKTRKPLKGGGSVSGFFRNNNNRPIPSRIPINGAQVGTYRGRIKRSRLDGFGDQGTAFSGNIKSQRALKGGGSISGRPRNNGGQSIGAKIPASGGNIGRYSGNIKGSRIKNYSEQGADFSGFIRKSRPQKGGGSISGRSRNNNGNAIASKIPSAGAARAGTYSGNLKSYRGSNYLNQGEEFTGFLKARKPLKGGGSISGRSRNNRGNAISTRVPTPAAAKAGTYSGNLKSARVFNYNDQGEEFTGFIKSKKPVKGGGSISGKVWNNRQTPIDVRTPLVSDAKAANYSGKRKLKQGYFQNELASRLSLKKKEPKKGAYLVEGLQGKVKQNDFVQNPRSARNSNKKREPEKGAYAVEGLQVKVKQHDFAQNPRSARSSNKKQEPEKGAYAVEGLQIKVKQEDYIQNRLASKNSIKKREPEKGAFAAEGLQIKVRRDKYEKNPNAKPGALRAVGPNSSTVKASEYMGRMKVIWDYKHNPSSNKSALDVVRPNRAFAKGNEYQGRTRLTKDYRHNPKSSKDALKVIAPGKAYAKISNYQGNLKMSKPHGRDLHPDAKFAHGHINNVKQERTILTNAKLWWSRLFKKSDTQPNAVKEKVKRPRYDKKERELWKDLYD